MAIDAGYGSYLKSPARYVTAQPGSNYGDKATTSDLMSPIAAKADAQQEAIRQAAFMARPIARDTHTVKGQRRDLIGKVVRLTNARLGYANGELAFVITASESETDGTTTLTVLRRL